MKKLFYTVGVAGIAALVASPAMALDCNVNSMASCAHIEVSKTSRPDINIINIPANSSYQCKFSITGPTANDVYIPNPPQAHPKTTVVSVKSYDVPSSMYINASNTKTTNSNVTFSLWKHGWNLKSDYVAITCSKASS